jgi:drug/metabolite transporter (DMT)-like permease
LSAIAGLLGLVTFLFYGFYISWLYGAIFMLINWPYTWYLIMPLNRELKAIDPSMASDEAMAKLSRWGWMHLLRGLLGAAGVLFYFLAATDMLQRVPGIIQRAA